MDSVIVPILNDELTILSFVVPKDFASRIEMKAAKIIDGFENHPSHAPMDPNNKMMQTMSFVLQTSFDFYDNYVEDDSEMLPDIDDVE
jgi:hypothetical protein|tara:strand:+ start:276 stop:539 length:264 start_codon:yes stop_codon:yes gene_type:complete